MDQMGTMKNGISTNREREVLLTLLRSGLWEKEPDGLSCFPLSETGWENVFRLARQQTVTGLVFQGLQYLPDDLLPSETLLLRWAAETDAIERRNQKMNAVLEALTTLFREQGLNPILQKGQGTARFYNQPLLRECGDIDFYFNNPRAWETALVCLRFQRIALQRQGDGSLIYSWQGVDVEHHRRLFDLYNPFQQGIVNRLEERKGYRQIRLSPTSNEVITVPSPFLELLLHNLHILKHALGRGIGLRQLCDMARACYHLHEEIDSKEMETVCRKLGLDRWSQLLHAFLIQELGLPEAGLPYRKTAPTAQPLTDIVWRGGNFGQHNAKLAQGYTGWQRKRQTACSFGDNAHFAFRYAPKETFWFFLKLMKGQMR